MLGPNVIETELPRLFDGQFENAFGLGSERHFAERQRIREFGKGALELGFDGLEAEA